MKKLLFLPLLFLGVAFSSCNIDDNDPYYGYICVTDITTENHQTGAKSSIEFDYVEYDAAGNPMPIVDGKVKSIPIINSQRITNGTTSEIKYTYSENMKYLTIDSKNSDGQTVDKYRLNDVMMADGKLVGSTYVDLDNIKYDSKGYRTFYNGNNIFSESGEYTRVEKDGQTIATYNYSILLNVMGFQQLGILGEEYINACDNFGKQSRHFLSSAIIKEDGNNVLYEFKYELDYYGYIRYEYISRDNKPYITRKYNYASVTVDNTLGSK
ncbi:MAG: hypothetical protein RR388_06000 [Rikenellaceae bacterium]